MGTKLAAQLNSPFVILSNLGDRFHAVTHFLLKHELNMDAPKLNAYSPYSLFLVMDRSSPLFSSE